MIENKCMKSLYRFIFCCFMLCSLTSTAQLLSVDNCYSGTKDESFYSSFKFNDNDSIRYVILESSSENNFFDSISNSFFPNENIVPFSSRYSQGAWIVALNENTKQTTRKYIGYYYGTPQAIRNQILFVKYVETTNSPLVRSLYAFTMDRDLNFTSPKILIDSFTGSDNGVYSTFFTMGDSVANLYVYQFRNTPHDQIHSYKINNTGIVSSMHLNSLRYLNGNSYNLLIKNNKIFECSDSVLKIYNAEAELLGSYQILNNNETVQRGQAIITDLEDSAVLIKVYTDSGSLNLIKINKHNGLDFNIHASFPGMQYFYTLEGMTDSNLVVSLNSTSNDSTYFIKFDHTGNVINRYVEKYCYVFAAEDYTNSLRIIIKQMSAGMFVQKINKNGVPVSSTQISQTIFAQNTILSYNQFKDFIKTKDGRYFITLQYTNIGGGMYSTLFEYNPLSNTVILQSVLNTACNICNQPEFKDIFSDTKNEVYAFANVNNECVRNADVVLYKLANGINTIKGKIYIDYNNNNTQDTGEPLYENARLSYAKNDIVYSNYLIDTGIYTFIIDTGKYEISCRLSDSLFTLTPASRTITHSNYNNTDFINFILKPIGKVYDAEVIFNNTFVTRPGFNGTYALTYSNNGNYPLTNFTVKALPDNRLNITSASNTYLLIGDTLVWNNLSALQPGERKTIFINFTAATPPELNNNDLLTSTAIISIAQNDTNPSNNQFIFSEQVRGSYDPNEKTVSENKLTNIDVSNNKSLHYTIRFENEGTDTAFSITILDTLSDKINLNSFKSIASSHPYQLSIKDNNILTFYFKNILLPPKSVNASTAHGFISYEIKPDKNLVINDNIKNTAHILFDYNLPITTNTTTTQIQLVSSIINKSLQDKILIYPNPAREQITIQLKNILLNNASIKLTDVSGNIILSQKTTEHNISLDVHSLASGTYFLIFENDHQVQTSKFIITR